MNAEVSGKMKISFDYVRKTNIFHFFSKPSRIGRKHSILIPFESTQAWYGWHLSREIGSQKALKLRSVRQYLTHCLNARHLSRVQTQESDQLIENTSRKEIAANGSCSRLATNQNTLKVLSWRKGEVVLYRVTLLRPLKSEGPATSRLARISWFPFQLSLSSPEDTRVSSIFIPITLIH